MNAVKATLFVIVLMGTMLLGTVASATIKLCLRTDVTYIDNGFGEDRLTLDGWARARGIRARVEGPTGWAWTGYVDYLGCTPTLDPPDPEAGDYDVTIDSFGIVNGQSVYALTGTYPHAAASTTTTVSVPGSGTYTTYVDSGSGTTQERFNMALSTSSSPGRLVSHGCPTSDTE